MLLRSSAIPRAAASYSTAPCARLFSTGRRDYEKLRIGYVPEHFATPLHFAYDKFGLADHATIQSFPSGTGTMIDAFKKQEIDVGIGLTEAWVVGLTKNADKPYHMVGAYTLSPLLWAISTGGMREDISVVEELQGLKAGISRFGSGSHIMASVLAQKYGWINDNSPPFDFVECGPFAPLRDAVGLGQADFFMWEHFTSKRYYYDKSLKKLGDIETPWNAWHIAARGETADPRVAEHLLPALEKGIEHFKANKEESANFIASTMAYSQEDAQEWYEGVKFASRQELGKLDQEMIEKTLAILDQAGVLGQSKISSWKELAATKPDVYA